MIFVAIGLAATFLLAIGVTIAAWYLGSDWLSGLSAIRAALRKRPLHEHFVELIITELRPHTDGVTGALALLVLGLAILLGGRLLHLQPGLNPEFVALHVPAVAFLAWAGYLLNQKRVKPEDSLLYRTLFMAPSSILELVPTTVLMSLNVTTLVDALAQTRVTQTNTPVPHVLMRLRDGSHQLLRALHDQDFGAVQALAELRRVLPEVHVGEPIALTPTPQPAATPPGGRTWLIMTGIAALTAATAFGAQRYSDGMHSQKRLGQETALSQAAAMARGQQPAQGPLSCSLTAEQWAFAFTADRKAGLDWPSFRGTTPFEITSTGQSGYSGLPKYVVSADVDLNGTLATASVVVLDFATGQTACAGTISGPVDPRVPGGIGRSIDALLLASLRRPGG